MLRYQDQFAIGRYSVSAASPRPDVRLVHNSNRDGPRVSPRECYSYAQMSPTNVLPNVLCISGHDPSGGAGLQADIEAVAAQGCHSAGLITALTRQDTRNAYRVTPIADDEFCAQLDILLGDMTFSAIKLGLLGSVGQVQRIAQLASAYPNIPLVLDPVLKAGGGAELAQDPLARALKHELLPRATVITPNAAEARRLCAEEHDLDACGRELAQHAAWVLITGGDEDTEQVANTLYGQGGYEKTFKWPRLAHHYHGSGCTLASALAAQLALGANPESAVSLAQDYTWQCLKHAFKPGQGQHIPNRLRRDDLISVNRP